MSSTKTIKYSISAVNALRRCGRQFMFQQIVASARANDPLRKRAHFLKGMKSLPMWKGTIVETAINEFLLTPTRGIQNISWEELSDRALNLARQQFDFSFNREYNKKDVDKKSLKYCVLDIHEVGKEYDKEYLQTIYDGIEQSIKNLYEVEVNGINIIDLIKRASWYRPNMMSFAFNFENIRVSPQIDLLMYVNNKPVIIDWKVSDNPTTDYSKQMTICGIAVKYMNDSQGRTKLPYKDISIHEVNLLLGDVKHHPIDADKAGEVIDYIYGTVGDIATMRDNVSYDGIEVKKYDMTDKSATCALCNFQTICKQVVEQNHKLSHESRYQLF